ncbi:MAG TPA: hypothetical protein VGI70_07795 [Polyangiales bacterium]
MYRPRPGLSGRTPGEPDESDEVPSAPSARDAPHFSRPDEPDKQYMEPPSEAFGRAPTQQQTALPEPPLRHEPRAPSWQDELAGRANPYGATSKQAVRPASSLPPSAPEPPRPSPYSATAPEAWREAARNVADRAKTAAVTPQASFATATRSPGSSMSPRPPAPPRGEPAGSLRLKLDADEVEGYDEHYKGVPKSRLPAVLLVFLILLIAAGGGAYWAEEHGGLASVAARLHLGPLSELLGGSAASAPAFTPPPSAAGTPPPSAAGTPPPSAASTSAAKTSTPTDHAPSPPPSAASATKAEATTDDQAAARALAEPDMPAADAAQANAKPNDSSVAKAEPAAKHPAKTAPHHAAPKPIVHHDPVLKIREVGAQSATPGTPPEPSDTPYIPTPIEPPPPPDEPR